MKKVSCVIPVYGLCSGDNYLFFDELLKSLSKASRSLGNQYELIVINDDKNRVTKQSVIEICAKYGLKNVLVYKENEHNSGQAFSRNEGASLATGEYLHFIDQDDYISDDFYDLLLASSSNKDLLIATPYFSKDSIVMKAYTNLLTFTYGRAKTICELWYLLISNIVYSPGQALISKRSFDMGGGFPVLEKRGADDFAFFYKLVFGEISVSVAYSKKSSFYYRIHSQQNSKLSSTNDSACEFLENYYPSDIKQRIVHYSKTKKWTGPLCKLFYILYYKRA